jgi:hypothetical protein
MADQSGSRIAEFMAFLRQNLILILCNLGICISIAIFAAEYSLKRQIPSLNDFAIYYHASKMFFDPAEMGRIYDYEYMAMTYGTALLASVPGHLLPALARRHRSILLHLHGDHLLHERVERLYRDKNSTTSIHPSREPPPPTFHALVLSRDVPGVELRARAGDVRGVAHGDRESLFFFNRENLCRRFHARFIYRDKARFVLHDRIPHHCDDTDLEETQDVGGNFYPVRARCNHLSLYPAITRRFRLQEPFGIRTLA